ncbi:MAG: hypothetical protein NXI24_10695 [bacterium]|nr:hypothetical protein [bacterium]
MQRASITTGGVLASSLLLICGIALLVAEVYGFGILVTLLALGTGPAYYLANILQVKRGYRALRNRWSEQAIESIREAHKYRTRITVFLYICAVMLFVASGFIHQYYTSKETPALIFAIVFVALAALIVWQYLRRRNDYFEFHQDHMVIGDYGVVFDVQYDSFKFFDDASHGNFPASITFCFNDLSAVRASLRSGMGESPAQTDARWQKRLQQDITVYGTDIAPTFWSISLTRFAIKPRHLVCYLHRKIVHAKRK